MSAEELYGILQLRSQVFVVEQNCPYQDLDDKDRDAWHCCAMDDEGNVIGTSRVFMYDEQYVQIGRVVTAESVRGTGIGEMIMDASIRLAAEKFGNAPIMIHAQSYASGFYEKFGFRISSEEFLEDGIPHREMIRKPS